MLQGVLKGADAREDPDRGCRLHTYFLRSSIRSFPRLLASATRWNRVDALPRDSEGH